MPGNGCHHPMTTSSCSFETDHIEQSHYLSTPLHQLHKHAWDSFLCPLDSILPHSYFGDIDGKRGYNHNLNQIDISLYVPSSVYKCIMYSMRWLTTIIILFLPALQLMAMESDQAKAAEPPDIHLHPSPSFKKQQPFSCCPRHNFLQLEESRRVMAVFNCFHSPPEHP